MFRKILASLATVALAVGLAVSAAAPASATNPNNTNDPVNWVAVTGETCAKWDSPGVTSLSTAALVSHFSLTNRTLTKVIVKAGSSQGQNSVTYENIAYYADAQYVKTMANTWWTVANLATASFIHLDGPAGGPLVASGKTISHVIVCSVPTPRTSVTPQYSSTSETCVADALVAGSISVVLKTGIVYSLTGPGNVVIDISSGSSGPLVAGTTYRLTAADSNPNDLIDGGSLSVDILIAPYGDDCGSVTPTPVQPAFDVQDQFCDATGDPEVLANGFITVDLTVPGVVYTITDANGDPVAFDPVTGKTAALPVGSYTVGATDADPTDAYLLAAPYSEPAVIDAFGDDCGSVTPTPVQPAFDVQDQFCDATGDPEVLANGFITVDLTVPGVVYTITDANGDPVAFDPATGKTAALPVGAYTVGATDADPTDAYLLAAPYSEPAEIDAYGDDCGTVTPTPVTAGFTVQDQTCDPFSEPPVLVNGFITVQLKAGIVYTITDANGDPVAFDPGTGKTAALPVGSYTVAATDADPSDAYVLAAPFSDTATIDPRLLPCGLDTFPDVVPSVSYTEPTCAVPTGSYRLSNDATLPGAVTPAVFWTVAGAPKAEGVAHTAAAGSAVTILATANGPTYGFGGDDDGMITFEHTFAAAPTACGDLETLALTGQPTTPLLAIAGLLGLLGVGLVRTARHREA